MIHAFENISYKSICSVWDNMFISYRRTTNSDTGLLSQPTHSAACWEAEKGTNLDFATLLLEDKSQCAAAEQIDSTKFSLYICSHSPHINNFKQDLVHICFSFCGIIYSISIICPTHLHISASFPQHVAPHSIALFTSLAFHVAQTTNI